MVGLIRTSVLSQSYDLNSRVYKIPIEEGDIACYCLGEGGLHVEKPRRAVADKPH